MSATEHAPRLADWEIRTIEAVAREELEAKDTVIWSPDDWLDKVIARHQSQALEDARVRQQLKPAAYRLDILHYNHPAPVSDLPELPTPDDSLGSRWNRITQLKLRTAADHPWAELFHELVTRPVEIHRHTTHPWHPDDAGIGILELLEDQARVHELIAGDAPDLTALDATHQMLLGAGVAP